MISSGMDQAWIPVDNSTVVYNQERMVIIFASNIHTWISLFGWIVYGFSHGIDSSPFFSTTIWGKLGVPAISGDQPAGWKLLSFSNRFSKPSIEKTSKIQGSQQNDHCRERLQICSLRKMILQSQETMTQNLHPSNSRWN